MKLIIALFLTMVTTFGIVGAQSEMLTTVDAETNKDSHLFLFPTAYTKQKAQYEIHFEMEPFLTQFTIGVSKRLTLGVSYGGEYVVGTNDPEWYPRVEFMGSYRMIDETYSWPAVALGFSSVGWGHYFEEYDRYLIKSRGFFLAFSKQTNFLGGTGLHGGVNYSVEGNNDEKKDGISLFCGITKNLNEELAMMLEYDFAFNDKGVHRIGDGKGWMNAGLRWTFAPELVIDFQVINILQNASTDPTEPVHVSEQYNKTARNLTITYRAFF